MYLIDPESHFVDAFHFARRLPPLHQADHCAAQSLGVLSEDFNQSPFLFPTIKRLDLLGDLSLMKH